METVLLKPKGSLSKLEKCLYRRNFYKGHDRDIRDTITEYLSYFFDTSKVSKDQIENLLLSVLAGKKRTQWRLRDDVFSSSVYANAVITFETYVKCTKDDPGAYERQYKFLQLLLQKVEVYCGSAFGKSEQEMFCSLIISMICHMDLVHAQKLHLVTWMCELMFGNYRLQWRYREFIIETYSSVFPDIFSQKQKEKMLEKYGAFWQ